MTLEDQNILNLLVAENDALSVEVRMGSLLSNHFGYIIHS